MSGAGSIRAQRRQSEVAIAEVTVIPIGTGSTSLSSYVADMQKVLEQRRVLHTS